jgi:hypothetical protein
MGRLQEDGELKFAARLFVLPGDEIVHQPFHMLPQTVAPVRVPQVTWISLIRKDGVPVALDTFT